MLDEVIAFKQQEVGSQKELLNKDTLITYIEDSIDIPRGFMSTLQYVQETNGFAIIAEIPFHPTKNNEKKTISRAITIAQSYSEQGVACLSVPTDKKYLHGDSSYLKEIRQIIGSPLLRNDFIVDEYQVLESKILGADCILLIAAMLNDTKLLQFTRLAQDLGIDILIEIKDETELERVLELPVRMIVLNNHDALEKITDMQKRLSPEYTLVVKTRFQSYEEIMRMRQMNVNTFLLSNSQSNTPQEIGKMLEKLIIG